MATPTNTQARALGINELTIEALMAFLTGLNNDGTAFELPVNATVVAGVPSATATLSNVDCSDGANHTLLAANAARKGAAFYNDSSSASLFLKFGATASATSFTVKVASQGYYELPTTAVYTGRIDAIESTTNGTVRVTELS